MKIAWSVVKPLLFKYFSSWFPNVVSVSTVFHWKPEWPLMVPCLVILHPPPFLCTSSISVEHQVLLLLPSACLSHFCCSSLACYHFHPFLLLELSSQSTVWSCHFLAWYYFFSLLPWLVAIVVSHLRRPFTFVPNILYFPFFYASVCIGVSLSPFFN